MRRQGVVRPKVLRWPMLVPGALLVLVVISCMFPDWVWPVSPTSQDALQSLERPSWGHPLGTDLYGRDVLARILHGGRWSLGGAFLIAIVVNVGGLVFGAILLSRHPAVRPMTRFVEALVLFPSILVVFGMISVAGPSFRALALALIVANGPWYTRVYRDLFRRTESLPHIEAARSLGATNQQLIVRHIVPLTLGQIAVLVGVGFTSTLLQLSAFSFLGFGVRPPTPEWGTMLADARPLMQRDAWQLIPAGGALVITSLCVQMLLQDPRHRT